MTRSPSDKTDPALRHVQQTYEAFGEEDPLYAVLSDERYKDGKWDPEAFFATGRDEVERDLAWCRELGATPNFGAALDFGCGVGRLTQALGVHFEQVIGIDISSSMVAAAEQYNPAGSPCRFRVNTGDTLDIPDASLDFVYTLIALQHSPTRFQRRYLAEFLRILRPGGLALFQLRVGGPSRLNALQRWWYRAVHEQLKPGWKRLRGQPPVQVHRIGRQDVLDTITEHGGVVVGERSLDRRLRRSRQNLQFLVRKPGDDS